ncbi:cellulose synthase complex outer membrane protein BcsC [Halomonas sp. M20]|uniref:cellulose synthase complex outer membrane protein BcsC n=1 Tax=Halomonas sp. M20 TaxID=2763264 RepID=UPI001D0B49B6|nr:cellulose synthase complex outer membrane protein BcsC [Halomonas sp. M20]
MKPTRSHWPLSLCLLASGVIAPPLHAQTDVTPIPNENRPNGNQTNGTGAVSPEAWLLQQLRLGEARQNDVLVKQALERLKTTAPDDPRVLQAEVRKAVREDDLEEAQRLVERLAEEAPNSEAYRLARLNLALTEPEQRSALSKARLLATTGQAEQAKTIYDDVLAEGLPTLPLALEYWQMVAQLPNGTPRAIDELQALDERYPQSPELRFTLARFLFSEDRNEEAFMRLEQLADNPYSRKDAARQWRDALREMEASEQSVAGWERFLTVFGDTDYAEEAQQTLTRHRDLLADPNYQARLRGLARNETEGGEAGEADIQRALAAYPDDIELLGVLGTIRLRQGRHDEALALFRRGEQLDDSPYARDKWSNLIATATYWQQIKQGDEALANGNDRRAEQAFELAQQQIAKANEAWLGLGDVARYRDNRDSAERAYRQALRLEPGYTTALERLASLYAEESPQAGLDFIDSLPPNQQMALEDTRRRLQVALLRAEGEELAAQSRWYEASGRFARARKLAPGDVWVTYALANTLTAQNRQASADQAFRELFNQLDTPEERAQGRYAQALYLSSDDREILALDALERIPQDQRDDSIQSLQVRLERSQLLARAEQRRAQGNESSAIAMLQSAPAHAEVTLRLGDWALERNDDAKADTYYRRALELDPDSNAARLGLVDTALAQGDRVAARRQLETIDPPQDALNARRRQVNAWAALGETQRAQNMMDELLADEEASKDALTLRDAGRLAQARGQSNQALQRYRQAMVAAELGDRETLEGNAAFTRQTRALPGDDWLVSSLRSSAAEVYRSQNTRVRYGHQRDHESGTSGVSELTSDIDMLEIDTPLAGGRGLLRVDRVRLDAGRLDREIGGFNRDTFGTCAVAGCNDDFKQQQTGVSVGVGWYNETWRVDIGTTPMGFEVTDVVGGVTYSGDAGPLWFDATVSRRALDDSILAYAGVEDPRTGTTWGGVRATGGSIGLGYDQGGPWGVWSKFGAHHLDGKNVKDNTRVRAMGGVYRKLINRPDERLSVGVSTMYMHYDKELGGYTLGQGGYYSPQQYISLALPVTYARRTEDWSWEIGASISQSWTDSDDSKRYPLGGSDVASLADANATRSGGSGGDFGYGVRGQIERRLGDHWSASAGFAVQEAEDYSPNMINLTLRYNFEGWQGELDLPTSALSPYADFD